MPADIDKGVSNWGNEGFVISNCGGVFLEDGGCGAAEVTT